MIFVVFLDVVMEEVFECKYILMNLVKLVAILYLLREFGFTVTLIIRM